MAPTVPGEIPYPPTGVALIDAAHDAISELVRLVERAASEGDGDRAVQLVTELETAIVGHFLSEEQLMGTIAYPERERHRFAHQEYLAHLRTRAAELRASGLTPQLRGWAMHLDGWFRAHVIAEDLWLGTALVDAALRSGSS